MIKIELTIKNSLPLVFRNSEARASGIIQSGATNIETDAKAHAPVRTGELRDSIHTTTETPLSATVGADAGHAAFVELGTRRMAARPFMLPAFERTKDRIVQEFKKLFR